MHFNFFKTTAWQLVAASDTVAWLILIGLFMLSVFCIAIVAFKFFSFRRHKRHLNQLTTRLKNARTFNELIAISKEFKETMGGSFLLTALAELKTLIDSVAKKKNPAQTNDESGVYLSAQDFEQLEISVDQIVTDTLATEEEYLPVLSTSAAAAPLIGLFGTIWGLIRTFIDIGQDKSTDISTVAPGLAEALVVTLAGLVVAIPALIAFHYFAQKLKRIERQIIWIEEKYLAFVKQTFVK